METLTLDLILYPSNVSRDFTVEKFAYTNRATLLEARELLIKRALELAENSKEYHTIQGRDPFGMDIIRITPLWILKGDKP